MERILDARGDWQTAIAGALAAAPRPIPMDDRLLARTRDGEQIRRMVDRAALPPARPAATLLAIYPDEAGRLLIPVTVRRAELRAHAGEVSLPGGRVDAADASHEAAALREAWEEIGLAPESVRILGTLDEVWIPVSNYELRPFVGAVDRRPVLVPHDAEVASIVELPLDVLFDAAAVSVEELLTRGLRIRAGAYRFGGLTIWGATAMTLSMLAHVLADRGTDGLAANQAPGS
jgi:8-oxo-dGTP pyrophosphatase MutT (NUDIX family)